MIFKCLDYIVATTGRRSGIGFCGSNGSLLKQPHELPHRVGDHNLCISFYQDV